MNQRNNRRSEATKKKIKQALVDLLHDQELNKITVQALCEQAAINRSTFYNHYESPASVLNHIESDFAANLNLRLQESFSDIDQPVELAKLIGSILEYLQLNQQICFLLQTPTLQPFFRRNVFRSVFQQTLLKHPVFEKYDTEHLPYVHTFILYGCGHVIDLWLQRGCEESPEEIGGMLAAFISRV